ncbi:MAG: hypothetical protein ACJA0N_000233 [Pseudohongiellaceae bacterium]|jgi:hypothetical protein
MELSFTYLRDPYPSLALTLQNQLYKSIHNPQNSKIDQAQLTLTNTEASEIIIALSNIAEELTEDKLSGTEPEQLIQLRSLLLDWLIYAQSAIEALDVSTKPQD